MTLKKLKEISRTTGKLPIGGVPRVGIRSRSAEGFVGRPAGLEPKPPRFDRRNLKQSTSS